MTRILLEVPIDATSLQTLRSLPGVTVEQIPFHEKPWDISPAQAAFGPEILLCKWTPSNIEALPSLKYIQITTVGYEHLRDRGFADRPIRFCNLRGVFDTSIAEWNVAMMINLVRDMRGLIRHQEHGVWEKAPRFQEDIRGRVVGIWGYGGIGRETARLAKALGMTVHIMTRNGVRSRESYFTPEGTGDPQGAWPDKVYVTAQKREFLSGLDFLILALPHTKESDGLLGEEELKTLPRHAYLLNPARGPIVQEQALLTALRRHWIAGAALDTHFYYPLPADHPLWRFPNVILTPHISGSDRNQRFPARVGEMFLTNVKRYLGGESLLNELKREEWLQA